MGLLFPIREWPKAMLIRWVLKRLPHDLDSMDYGQLEYLGIEDASTNERGDLTITIDGLELKADV